MYLEATEKRIQHLKMGPLRPLPCDWAEPAVHNDTCTTDIEAHRITLKIGINRLPLALYRRGESIMEFQRFQHISYHEWFSRITALSLKIMFTSAVEIDYALSGHVCTS